MRLPNSAIHTALAALTTDGPDRELVLSLTPITVTAEGLTGVTEPDAPSYAPAAVPASAWSAPADRAATTTLPVQFPDPTEDWGVIVAYALTDGAGTPQIPCTIQDGGYLVAAGAQDVQLTPRITSPL